MRIAVLTSRFPFPIERGDKLRLFHQIKSLSKNHDIYLVALSDHQIGANDINQLDQYCMDIKVFEQNRFNHALNLMKNWVKKWPLQVGVNFNKKIDAQIKEHLDTIQPDLVYCQLIRMAPFALGLDYPIFIDYMDAYGVGMSRRAKIARPILRWIYQYEAKHTKIYERDIYPKFNGHSIISEQDKELIGFKNCAVIPNGIDADYFNFQHSTPKHSVGFIGNMGYLPNIQAAEYLCKSILPSYTNQYKEDLKVLVAGARPHHRVKRLASETINITGWVDDIRSAYSDCKILVAPLFQGTGQQNKILEAMAMGIPCITTYEVNKAIRAIHQESILIADSPTSFAEAIYKLKNNTELYNTIRQNARQFIETQYSWNASINKLNTIFADIINNDPKRLNKEA